jgi:tRNA (guanine-N(7)-)-methyltransferase subunit TRM82
MSRQQSLQLSGNVLDVTEAENDNTVFVSVDGVHESGSTRTWRDEVTQPQIFVQAFTMKTQGENKAYEPANSPTIDNINRHGTEDILKSTDEAARAKEQKVLSESLYNVGNLRKRGRGDDAKSLLEGL